MRKSFKLKCWRSELHRKLNSSRWTGSGMVSRAIDKSEVRLVLDVKQPRAVPLLRRPPKPNRLRHTQLTTRRHKANTTSLEAVLEGMFILIFNICLLHSSWCIKAAAQQALRSTNYLIGRLYDRQLQWLASVSNSMLVAVGIQKLLERTASPAASLYV